MSDQKIIITSPKVIRKRTEAVVISPKNTLYDANAQLSEPVVVMSKVEPVQEPKEQVLYTTNAEQAADFSWQTEEAAPPPEPQPLDELLKTAEPEAREYIAVTTSEKSTEPPKESSMKVADWLTLLIFAGALFIGGKAFFDYTQEFTSFKRIANQLEQEASPPKINLRNFVDENADDAASITKRNAFRSKTLTAATIGLSSDGWVEVIKTKPYYLLARRKDGKIELRTGGVVGWRTNNPGEFGYAKFAQELGAMGKYSKYAIFPSIKKGMGAVEVYLFNTNIYQGLSIDEAIKKFYAADKVKSERVAKAISVALNLSRFKTKMTKLSESQKKKLLSVIRNEEMKLKGITRLFSSMEEFNQKGF